MIQKQNMSPDIVEKAISIYKMLLSEMNTK